MDDFLQIEQQISTKCTLCIIVLEICKQGRNTWYFCMFNLFVGARMLRKLNWKLSPFRPFMPNILIVVLTKAENFSQKTKKDIFFEQLNILFGIVLSSCLIDAANIAHLMSTHSIEFSLIILLTFSPPLFPTSHSFVYPCCVFVEKNELFRENKGHSNSTSSFLSVSALFS